MISYTAKVSKCFLSQPDSKYFRFFRPCSPFASIYMVFVATVMERSPMYIRLYVHK